MSRYKRLRLLAGATALALALGATVVSVPTAAYASDDPNAAGFVTIRANWLWTLNGGASNPSDPAIAATIADITTEAATLQSTMDTSTNRTYLWSDLVITPSQDQATVTGLTYQRLEKMALAFRTNGSSLQNDTSLKSKILGGLQHLYDTAYNPTNSATGNWWWDDIGGPIALLNSTILMWDHLTPVQRADYEAAVRHHAGNGGCNSNARGPNAVWGCVVQMLRGAVAGRESDVHNVRNSVLSTISTNGSTISEGFHPDGSITTHGSAYNGGYGVEALVFMAAIIHAYDQSTFDFTVAQTDPMFDTILDYYAPFFYNGAIVSSMRGREISRWVRGDHDAGGRVLAALAGLAKEAPSAKRPEFTSFIKTQAAANSQDTYDGLPVSGIRDIQSALVGATSSPKNGSKVFSYSDRVMHSRPAWTYALSMYSSRTYNYETTLQENLRGWFTSDGAGFVYNGDGMQTDGAYWPTVDSNYLPGTVVIDKSKTRDHKTGRDWVGGTTIHAGADAYTAAGMDYAPYAQLQVNNQAQTITAKKSWFLFDNEVVLMEAGVTSSSANTVRSVIENRKLAGAGTNALTVTTAAGSTSLTGKTMSQMFTGVTSMHLAGNGTADSMGYVFPDGAANVFGYRNAYSNKWSSINQNASQNPPGDPTLTERYQLLSRPYSPQPNNQAFSYVLLPGATTAQVDAYRTNSEVQTLANTVTVQAVEESTLGIVAANFWGDGPTTVNRGGSGWLTVDKKSSVMVRVTPTTVEVSVSDPTQLNAGLVTVSVAVPVQTKASGDSRIALTSDAGQDLSFTVEANGTKGSAITAVFTR